eukprot:scaffold10.g2320.t1
MASEELAERASGAAQVEVAGAKEAGSAEPPALGDFLRRLKQKYGILDSSTTGPSKPGTSLKAAGLVGRPAPSDSPVCTSEVATPASIASLPAECQAAAGGLSPQEPAWHVAPPETSAQQAQEPAQAPPPPPEQPQQPQQPGPADPAVCSSAAAQTPGADSEDAAAEDSDAIEELLRLEGLLQLRSRDEGEIRDADSSDGSSPTETLRAPGLGLSSAASSSVSEGLPGPLERCSPGTEGSPPSAAPPPGHGSALPSCLPPSARLPWPEINAALLQAGFPAVLAPAANGAAASSPEAGLAYRALDALLREHARLQAHAQRLADGVQGAGRREAAAAASLRAVCRRGAGAAAPAAACCPIARLRAAWPAARSLPGLPTPLVHGTPSHHPPVCRQKEGELQKWRRLALENQQLAREAQLAQAASGKGSQALAEEARRLAGRVEQLEREVHGKAAALARLQQHVAAREAREARRAAADKATYERLQRASAAGGAAGAPAAAAAAAAATVKGLRPLDICRIFETERASMAEELAVAQAERQVAEAQLARAKAALRAAGVGAEGGEELEGATRAAARTAAAAEARAARLEEEAAALCTELGARPTQAQIESLQRQVGGRAGIGMLSGASKEERKVAIMERQLHKAAAEKAAAASKAGSGGAAAPTPRPRERSTREAMRRDRGLRHLGLQAAADLPKPVLVETLQDACLLLECGDPLALCAAIAPVQDLAALVPRMESWIGDVCGAVFRDGAAHVPEALRQDSPADVPAILRHWLGELGALLEARATLRALCRALAGRRGAAPGAPPPTPAQAVPLVVQLVELESAALHSAEVIAAAEAALAADPAPLLHRIVRHFQELFGCPELGGVLPAMSRLAAAHAEAQAFLASLRTALGLPPGATLETCANMLQRLVEDKKELLLAMMHPAAPRGAGAGPAPEAQHAVVVEVAPRRRELQAAADAVIDRLAERRNFPRVEIYVPAPPGAHEAGGARRAARGAGGARRVAQGAGSPGREAAGS